MILYIVFIIIGFFLLIKGADFLVDGASGLAKKFKIPTIIIGLTIVAIGTSMPELMVSTTAAIEGHSDMSIGNVVGSNIANLFLILGICSIIRPLKFQKETEKIENLVTIFATILLLYFGNNMKSNFITRPEGIIFLICCIIFILYNIIIKYASQIAEIMGLSEKIISITIIAFSTSLPELITSINATIKGETDMAIGNIIGSQIFNIFLILGTSALLCPINYSFEYNIDMYFLIFGTVLFALFPFIGRKHHMTRANGIIFTIIYIIYLTYSVLKVI